MVKIVIHLYPFTCKTNKNSTLHNQLTSNLFANVIISPSSITIQYMYILEQWLLDLVASGFYKFPPPVYIQVI